jgi:uncharacterized membrane protein YdjX (TVP38/TMEM64 family)
VNRNWLTILLVLGATVALGALLFSIGPIRDAVSAAAHGDPGELRRQLDALGATAALVLVGIALVHVILPFPAEFPTAAAGYVLGFGVAFPLMVAAWTLSCVLAYGLARVVGPPVLDKLVGAERMARADALIDRGGWQILVLARLIPIVPYNLVSFAAGATRVPLWRFTWTTAIGVVPLTALTALLGSRLQSPRLNDPVLWAVLGGVLALIALAHPVGRRLRAPH